MSITFGYAHAADGTRLFYAMEPGEGVPLVNIDPMYCLHASQAANFASDLSFVRTMVAGSPWYSFDWRGKGMSAAGRITREALQSDIETIIRVAGRPCDIYAWGPSSHLAISLAAAQPGTVRRLLLAATRRYQRDSWFWNDFYRLILANPAAAMGQFLGGLYESRDVIEARSLGQQWQDRMPMESVERYRSEMLSIDDLAEISAGLETPVLLIAEPFYAAASIQAAEVLPGSAVVILPPLRAGPELAKFIRTQWDLHTPPISPAPPRHLDSGRLTDREAEVMDLILAGHSNQEISDRLCIAPSTAARHVANVFEKLGVHSRTQLMLAAQGRSRTHSD